MPTAIHRQVTACRADAFPRLIAPMPSGWAILGDPQVVRGYCLLLPDPVVPHLNAMTMEKRAVFLHDMTVLGDVLLKLTGAARINYEMLGNLEPALHAHLFPRYEEEAEDRRTAPIWLHDWDAAPPFDADADAAWMEAVREELRR
ncbi:MAG: hypothetical protein ACPG31_10240 [Planctomycetota bacterium]